MMKKSAIFFWKWIQMVFQLIYSKPKNHINRAIVDYNNLFKILNEIISYHFEIWGIVSGKLFELSKSELVDTV